MTQIEKIEKLGQKVIEGLDEMIENKDKYSKQDFKDIHKELQNLLDTYDKLILEKELQFP